MGEWFNQARFDLNEHSTKSLVEWAKDQVDAARLFARMDFPPRSPEASLREARAAVERLFDDKPAGLVLNDAGQSRDAIVRALEARKFEAVLSGLDQASRHGTERELPAAAAVAAPAIEAQVRHKAAEQRPGTAINPGQPRRISADRLPAARQHLRAPTQDAARSHWEAAAESGRKINGSTKPAEDSEHRAAQGRGHGRAH